MKPFAWLALILLFAPCLAQAVDNAPSDAPDKQTDYNKIVDRFFAALQASKYTDAAHVLIDTNPADEFNVDKHESLAVPLQKITETFGAFKMFKLVVSKTLGDGIGYVYGIAIYDRSPIRYEFMFYKDGTSWRLLHIDFNLNYVPELRDLAGVHIQTPPVYAPPPAPVAPATKPGTPPASTPAPAPATPTTSNPPSEPSPAPAHPSTTNPAPPPAPAAPSTTNPAAPAPTP